MQEKLQGRDSCLFRLDSLTDFSWDTLHIFWGPEWHEHIKDKYNVNVTTEQISDDEFLYVFVKADSSVYEDVIYSSTHNKCQFGNLKDHEAVPNDRVFGAYKIKNAQSKEYISVSYKNASK